MLVTLVAQFLCIFLPQKVAEFLAVVLADAFRKFDWRTKAVMQNMNIFFPEKSLYERKRLVRDTFRKLFVTYIRVMKTNPKKWEKIMVLSDLEVFRDKRSIIFSIHMGPWDIASKYVNFYNFNFYTLMENIPKFYLWMWLRFRKGIKVFIVGRQTLRAVQKLKKEANYALVVLVDRVTSGRYTIKRFMNRNVIFAEGITRLPKLIEGNVYFLTCHWDNRMEKVRFDVVGIDAENLESEIYNHFISSVKKYPDEWFNFYFFTTQRPT